ncbi:hypothetical protein Tco_0260937 [Tanacetum coccineum]
MYNPPAGKPVVDPPEDPITTSNGKPRHEPYSIDLLVSILSFSVGFGKSETLVGSHISLSAPLQMVSDMRRTRRQVLYAGEAGDARYPNQRHPFSKSTTSEWPLASDWSPVVNEECSKYVTLDKKLIQSSPFYFSDDDHSVDKVTIPSKRSPPTGRDNMEEAGPSLIEKPINGSLHLELALENSDHDTMIAAPSIRDLDQLAEVSRMRQV